jgi:hypothetical protein
MASKMGQRQQWEALQLISQSSKRQSEKKIAKLLV